MNCGDCRFFNVVGECHRRAPTIHAFYGGISERDGQVITSGVSGWPDVDRTDWCGEYEQRHCAVDGCVLSYGHSEGPDGWHRDGAGREFLVAGV